MYSKRILFILVSLWLCLTAQAQTPKENTLSILTHTVWEHGKPIYSDYHQVVYTDTTMTYSDIQSDGTMKPEETRPFYLTDRIESFFDETKVGKSKHGNYCMSLTGYGTFICYRIYELTKDKLRMATVLMQGRGPSPNIPLSYTPLRK